MAALGTCPTEREKAVQMIDIWVQKGKLSLWFGEIRSISDSITNKSLFGSDCMGSTLNSHSSGLYIYEVLHDTEKANTK